MALTLGIGADCAHAQQDWRVQHELFQNSESQHAHFYGEGTVSAPSTLDLIAGKLPVETSSFHSAPNSLRLSCGFLRPAANGRQS